MQASRCLFHRSEGGSRTVYFFPGCVAGVGCPGFRVSRSRCRCRCRWARGHDPPRPIVCKFGRNQRSLHASKSPPRPIVCKFGRTNGHYMRARARRSLWVTLVSLGGHSGVTLGSLMGHIQVNFIKLDHSSSNSTPIIPFDAE